MALNRTKFSFRAKKPQYSELPHDDTTYVEGPISQTKKSGCLILLLHALIVSFYTAIFLVAQLHGTSGNSCGMVPGTLPGLQLTYHDHIQTFDDPSLYSGLPSSNSDQNWDILMSTMRMRVSDKELADRDQTSVTLPEGGNLAWLGVYHQLHCVKLVRQYLYFDHYFPVNISGDDMFHFKSHADHCLEVLRQGAMCAGDASLTTFNWEPGKLRASVDLNGRAKQVCVDWNTLISSIKDRSVGQDEYDAMVNPQSS
ncbi:unnamed protein product [Discula destructiva]